MSTLKLSGAEFAAENGDYTGVAIVSGALSSGDKPALCVNFSDGSDCLRAIAITGDENIKMLRDYCDKLLSDHQAGLLVE